MILDSDPEILYFWRFERKRREKGGNTLQGKYYVCGGNEERRKKEGKPLKKENIFFCGCLDVYWPYEECTRVVDGTLISV